MTQAMMVTFEIDKEIEISTVVSWMNEKILGSKVTEVSIKNTDSGSFYRLLMPELFPKGIL